MTEASKEVLKKVLYICYLIWFKKNKIQALLDSGSEVNTIIPVFVSKLDLKICQIGIKAQKIDNSILKTFEIVLVSF